MIIIKRLFMTALHIVCGIYIILLANRINIDLSFNIDNEVLSRIEYFASYAIIAFLFVVIYTKIILRKPLKEIGLRLSMPKWNWIVIAFLLPISVLGFYIFFIDGQLVKLDISKEEQGLLVLEAILLGLSSGFVEEMVFRGLIMRGIEAQWNKIVAIIVPSVCFGVGHMTQIDTEDKVSTFLLFIGGTAVGIMFSVIAYKTGTIWANALVHAVWNMLLLGGIIEVKPMVEPWSPSIFTYIPKTKNVLLTGGAFGIEVGLPAIIAYSIVTIYVCLESKNDEKHVM